MNDETPELRLKPVFVGWLLLLAQLPIQLLLSVWAGGFFGGMFAALTHEAPHRGLPFPMIVIGAAVFVVIPLVAYVCKKYNYAMTEYRLFADRIEYEEGFVTAYKKLIKFADVTEVSLRKGMFQRAYGLGTIYLATHATGTMRYNNPFSSIGFGGVSGSGISIRDIRDPDAVYDRLKAAVDTNKSR